MPDLCIPPPNQCLMNEPDENDEALACLSPPSLPSTQPTAEFGGTDGAEGGDASGAEELVRRFGGDGAGGAPGTPGALSPEPGSCLREDLRVLPACLPLLAGGAVAPWVVASTALACASVLIAELECRPR